MLVYVEATEPASTHVKKVTQISQILDFPNHLNNFVDIPFSNLHFFSFEKIMLISHNQSIIDQNTDFNRHYIKAFLFL